MCFSALVEQDFQKLGLKKGDVIDFRLFRDLFKRRFQGENLAIPRALEKNFLIESGDPFIIEIKKLILDYRQAKTSDEEIKLFGYKGRLVEAERKLAQKPTMGAQKEKDVCERQMQKTLSRLEKLRSTDTDENDARIFPMGWAPMIILREGKRVVVPARYHLRPEGQEATFDRRYDGNYNARRENLEKVAWWKNIFGKNHGVFIVHKFFENVPKHKFEKRPLRVGEVEENLVLEFKPSDDHLMYVTAIYDVWPNRQKPEFFSAAAITMDPPPEVAETGHERCIIPIPEALVDSWLEGGKSPAMYYAILDQRTLPLFKHRIAA